MAPNVAMDYEGIWGKPTSTLDWCERNYEVTSYIAEFWNTVSNLWMIIPPLYGLYQARRQGLERRIYACYLALLLIGVGSWMFHMTLIYEMQLLDEIPMVFGSAGLVYAIYQVRQPPSEKSWGLVTFLVLYCGASVVAYLINKDPLFHEVMYGILVVAMVSLDIRMAIKMYSKRNVQILVTGCLMYLVGFMLWNIDNHFCPQIEAARQSLPGALQPFTQLHGWWHFGAGYATYLQIVAVTYQRKQFLKQECRYAVGWIGIRVDCGEDKPVKRA